jgi:hypothetical protein
VKYINNWKLFESDDENMEKTGFSVNFEKITTILEENCSEFIKLLKENNITGLYRGHKIYETKPLIDGFWNIKSTIRKPRDTDHFVSDIIDKGLWEKFGMPLRSRGVFASKDLSIAKDYGKFKREAFLFFPKNVFRYFWNPNIDDLFTHLRDEYEWYDITSPDADIWSEEAQSDLKWIINGYKEGDIDKVKFQEITFICDEYYLLDLDYFDQWENWIKS